MSKENNIIFNILTEKEKEIIKAIDRSDFGDDSVCDGVWFWSIDPKLEKKQISGVVSSLVKKGIVNTQDEGGPDHFIAITPKGLEVILIEMKDCKFYKPLELDSWNMSKLKGGAVK